MRECIGKFDQVISLKLSKSTFQTFKNDLPRLYVRYDELEQVAEKMERVMEQIRGQEERMASRVAAHRKDLEDCLTYMIDSHVDQKMEQYEKVSVQFRKFFN